MIRFFYTTFPSMEVAQDICRTLLNERIIACANILPGMVSIYHWENAVKTENEVSAFLKTTADRVDNVTERLEQLHPYDCPCIVTLSVDFVSGSYGRWISSEVP